jgi:putative flippase GtrA
MVVVSLGERVRALRDHELLGQLVRYAITGGGVTALGAGLYGALVGLTPIHEQLAVFAAYVVCVAIGYVLHSRWSFRGHGRRDDVRRTTIRFVTVSLVSYGLNSFFTWALVRGLDLPRWTPVLPILFVTPLATFSLNRRWVFA